MSQLRSRPYWLSFAVIAAASLVLLAFASVDKTMSTPHHGAKSDQLENSDASIAFRNDMRKLWEDHITWTRVVIISLAGDLPDQDAAVTRLLQNQDDIGDSVKPFYGETAGDQLTALLHEHISIAAELILAAKAGDTAAVEDASARWYANGDAIATFLNAANPDEWPLEEMKAMMRDHLDLTLAEAVARLSANYEADVAAYDAVHVQILEMADMLSLGIIHQFARQFK